eukprot:24457-Rhodomonas_salina.1
MSWKETFAPDTKKWREPSLQSSTVYSFPAPRMVTLEAATERLHAAENWPDVNSRMSPGFTLSKARFTDSASWSGAILVVTAEQQAQRAESKSDVILLGWDEAIQVC